MTSTKQAISHQLMWKEPSSQSQQPIYEANDARCLGKSGAPQFEPRRLQDAIKQLKQHDVSQQRRIKRQMSLPPTHRHKIAILLQKLNLQDDISIQKRSRPRRVSHSHIQKLRSRFELPARVTRVIDSLNAQTVNHLKSSDFRPTELVSDQLQRQRKSSREFGYEQDITLADIETNGLRALLQSRVPLAYFLATEIRHLAPENLLFFLHVHLYENDVLSTISKQAIQAENIAEISLHEDSPLQLNLDGKTLARVKEDVRAAFDRRHNESLMLLTKKCFSVAKSEVYKMLEVSYKKFRTGREYNKMLEDLGEGPCYSEDNQKMAVIQLVKSLLSLRNAGSLKRVLVIELHKFCRRKFQFDFNDTTFKVSRYG